MNLYVYTLGCRLNQCESEAVAESFEKSGHEVLKQFDVGGRTADLVIVNTCTVTSKAEQKARRMIRLFAATCPVLVTGCYAQMAANEIEGLAPNVVVLPLARKPELLKLPQFLNGRLAFGGTHPGDPARFEGSSNEGFQRSLLEFLREFASLRIPFGENGFKENRFDYAPSGFTYHCRSYLKVQDGCDNNCGYCRVHIARGPSSFLDADTAVKRALEIENHGYHEIVLTGVNLTMYDHNGRGLGGLMEKLLNNLGPDMRFRLSSMEPDNVDDLLLEQLADPRVQPHFHIPIQSASPKVMARINRNYSLEHLEYVVRRLREIKNDPFLACDIITGLPAEGDEEFEQTRRFLVDNGFAMMHVFPFSPRPNTPLEKARDKAPESVRDERAAILRALALEMNQHYLERQVGKPVEVILEENRNGTWYGLTGNYMRMKADSVELDAKCGDLVHGIVTSTNTVNCM